MNHPVSSHPSFMDLSHFHRVRAALPAQWLPWGQLDRFIMRQPPAQTDSDSKYSSTAKVQYLRPRDCSALHPADAADAAAAHCLLASSHPATAARSLPLQQRQVRHSSDTRQTHEPTLQAGADRRTVGGSGGGGQGVEGERRRGEEQVDCGVDGHGVPAGG
jgi:hypothetical protein